MGSIYAQPGASSGSVYAKPGEVDGTTAPTAPKKSGGGILGDLEHVAHVVAQKAELAGHDLKAMPGGIVEAANTAVVQPYKNLVTTGHPYAHGAGKKIDKLVNQTAESTVSSIEHPLRDPFATALNVLPLTHGLGKAADVAGVISHEPRLIEMGDAKVPLHASKNPSVRLVQQSYDKIIQNALDRQAANAKAGVATGKTTNLLARHAAKRIGGSLSETGRRQQAMSGSTANLVESQAKQLSPLGGHIPGTGGVRMRKLEEAALRLTSENSTPKEAAQFHLRQAADGVNPKQNVKQARLYQALDKKGWLTQDEHGNVIVDQAKHPQLARTDAAVAQAQDEADKIAAEHGLMTPEGLKARINGPARVRAGAQMETQKEANAARGVPAQKARVAQTREYPARSKTVTREMTQPEAQTRLASLDKTYDQLVRKLIPETSPFANKPAEQLRRNFENSRAGKGNRIGQKVQRTVSADEYRIAEDKLHELAGRHQANATANRVQALIAEREQLRDALNEKAAAAFSGPGKVVQLDTGPPKYDLAGAKRHPFVWQDGHLYIGGHGSDHSDVFAAMRARGIEPDLDAPHGVVNQVGTRKDMQQRVLLPSTKPEDAAAMIAALRREFPQAEINAGRFSPQLPTVTETIPGKPRRVQLREQQAVKGVQATPRFVGGEQARPGRGYVSHQTESGKLPGGHIAASPGPVIGEPKSYISKTKHFTGKNLRSGLVPDNTTQLVADHLRRAVRYSNTARFRDTVAKTGSDVKRSDRDVLIRFPGEKQNPAEVRAASGKAASTLDTIPEAESNPGTLRDHLEHLIPGLKDNFTEDKHQAVGVQAPKGTKWVDRKVLGDMGELAPQVDHFAGKLANRINSAVTAATVYFKPGHVATRVLTNASANVLQGSGGPLGIAKSVKLWHALSPEEQQKALLGAGQHSFQALPAQGTDVLARTARTGAKWWATHADAPFRFNSIAYEARKAGFDTPAKFREFLHQAETGETSDGKPLNAAQHAKVDWVGKRANREAIAYDRLNHFEKRAVMKVFWFYPWTKGATQFLGNTLMEHPYKSGALGAAGVQGRNQQADKLGDVPSYEFGLIPLGGGDRPESTDFSTFSPFSTPGDLLSIPAVGALSDQLNPAYGAAVQLATRTNQYGVRSKNPIGDATSQLFSPTPEAQILSAYQGRHQDQSQRMFEKTWLSQLERALVGPALPRRVNKSALAKAAARERSGR